MPVNFPETTYIKHVADLKKAFESTNPTLVTRNFPNHRITPCFTYEPLCFNHRVNNNSNVKISSNICEFLPPPEPPDIFRTSSLHLPLPVTIRGVTTMQNPDVYSFRMLQTSLQLFDELPKYQVHVCKDISSRYLNNELENVVFELFNDMYKLGNSLGVSQNFKRTDIGTLDLEEAVAIGAIFAATYLVYTLQVLNQDEAPLLYSLVFGEGVMDDDTSVVLFNAINFFDLEQLDHGIGLQFFVNFLYLFIASPMLGVLSGLLSAYIIKKIYFGRHSTDCEVSLMILIAYLTYIMADLSYLSSIILLADTPKVAREGTQVVVLVISNNLLLLESYLEGEYKN